LMSTIRCASTMSASEASLGVVGADMDGYWSVEINPSLLRLVDELQLIQELP
jgi:hypothetical protein